MGMNTKFVFEYSFFYIQIHLNVQILPVPEFYFAYIVIHAAQDLWSKVDDVWKIHIFCRWFKDFFYRIFKYFDCIQIFGPFCNIRSHSYYVQIFSRLMTNTTFPELCYWTWSLGWSTRSWTRRTAISTTQKTSTCPSTGVGLETTGPADTGRWVCISLPLTTSGLKKHPVFRATGPYLSELADPRLFLRKYRFFSLGSL